MTYAEFVASISCGRCGCGEARWSASSGYGYHAWECRDCGSVRIVDVPYDIVYEDEEE